MRRSRLLLRQGGGVSAAALVVVATPTMAGLEGFTRGLVACGAEVVHARSGMAALETARARAPSLVVVDSGLSDFRPFELVKQLARLNAAINTAVMSHLPEGEFHDKAEGLGVLAGLGTQPGEAEARELMRTLQRITGRSAG